MRFEIVRSDNEFIYLIKTVPGSTTEDTHTIELLKKSRRSGMTQACTYRELVGQSIDSEIGTVQTQIEALQARLETLLNEREAA